MFEAQMLELCCAVLQQKMIFLEPGVIAWTWEWVQICN